MILHFTTTAMCRPELYEQTLDSFRANLLGVEWEKCTLHLNVDPLPDATVRREVVAVAEKVFDDVFPNFPDEACFPAAVKWCWAQPEGEFFFHLEDDWVMTRPIEIGLLVEQMQLAPYRSCVNLRAYNFPRGDTRICLSPGLLRTTHARVMSSKMTLDANPEKQLRPPLWEGKPNPCGGRQAGFVGMQVPQTPILRDTGRNWLSKFGQGYTRSDGHFTAWSKNCIPSP